MKLATFAISSPAGPVRRIGALADLAGWSISRLPTAGCLARTDPGCDAERLAALLLPDDMVAFLGHRGTWLGRCRPCARRGTPPGGSVPAAARRYRPEEVRLLAPLPRPRVIRDFLTFEGHMRNASRAARSRQ